MTDTRRDDPTNSGNRCISDNGDFPLHLWTWTGGWESILPGEESWICYRCGAGSTTRTRTERPCASCANPYGHPYCGLLCGSEVKELEARSRALTGGVK